MATRKIFCLEGEWQEKDLRKKQGISSMLQFLHDNCNIEYVHRKLSTVESFLNYLQSLKRGNLKKYDIIYLAFHGYSNNIYIAKGHELSLEELAEQTEGLFVDRVIHFGSCKTLFTSERRLLEFKEATGARLISGFTKTIDFVDSTLLDIAYFTHLQDVVHVGSIERRMRSQYPDLCGRLGLKFI